MKTIGFLLLSFISITLTAQDQVWAGYPKWFVEDIPYLRPLNAAGPAPVKTISLSTGVKLEYAEQGDPEGVPVILLHGFPDSWRSYEQVLQHLPQSFHVFTISQRGHGNSDKPANGYFPKDFAGDVAAFMKALQIPSAVIVGHSMGATITQQFALSYPHLVRGIVLEGAIASFNDKKDMMDFKDVLMQMKDPMEVATAKEFQQSTLANPISEEYFNLLLAESMKVKANVWRGVWEGLVTAANFRAKIHEVKKPALIIWGEKDNFGPRADQDHFVTAIEGSQLVVYKGTGHSLHWEEPVRFARDITNFINSLH